MQSLYSTTISILSNYLELYSTGKSCCSLCCENEKELKDSVVLVIYDYILTFSQEFNVIWSSELSGATILFLINRYFSLLLFVSATLGTLVPSQSYTVGILIVISGVI